jgi:hypothetical protein
VYDYIYTPVSESNFILADDRRNQRQSRTLCVKKVDAKWIVNFAPSLRTISLSWSEFRHHLDPVGLVYTLTD